MNRPNAYFYIFLVFCIGWVLVFSKIIITKNIIPYLNKYNDCENKIEIYEADIEYYKYIIAGYEEANSYVARVSAYTARPQETNKDYKNTSIMEKVIPGWSVAINRDFGQWKGKRIYIEGLGIRYVNDYMNKRYDTNEVDIAVHTPSEAFEFGVQEMRVFLIEPYMPFDKQTYCQ